ncbi:MAG: hypothetical protein KBE22_06565 [Candidatus Accumulibacter sp.]|nr:hypothetical protein [Accumulibacter sp.]
MTYSPSPLTSFAGQVNQLISAVEESEREQVALAEYHKNAFADRKKNMQRWRNEQELKHKNEIIDYLRSHPGSQTAKIYKGLGHDRSVVFRRLRKLEVDGIIACVANGNILKWTLI